MTQFTRNGRDGGLVGGLADRQHVKKVASALVRQGTDGLLAVGAVRFEVRQCLAKVSEVVAVEV